MYGPKGSACPTLDFPASKTYTSDGIWDQQPELLGTWADLEPGMATKTNRDITDPGGLLNYGPLWFPAVPRLLCREAHFEHWR